MGDLITIVQHDPDALDKAMTEMGIVNAIFNCGDDAWYEYLKLDEANYQVSRLLVKEDES